LISNRVDMPEVSDLSTNLNRGLYDSLAVDVPNVNVPNINDLTERERALILGAINTPMGNPTTPQEAMQQALGFGEIGGGRMGLGRGFSVGKVPGGYGIQFDKMFAQGGAVTSGIGSLGLPVRFKSTNS
jgi:L-aminopeptidase/D-esterase-like protein